MLGVLIGCSLICIGAYRWGDTKWESAKIKAIECMYSETLGLMQPYLTVKEINGMHLVYQDVEQFFVPLISEFRMMQYQAKVIEDVGQDTSEEESIGTSQEILLNEEEDNNEDSTVAATAMPEIEKQITINRVKLQEFDYLRQNFYQVDNTTTIDADLLNIDKLLGKDMTIKANQDGPQILIYHTHSQESYKDSVPGDAATTIVGVGDYLEELLEQKYGMKVLHHKGEYDVEGRNNAYSRALPDIERILKENPTIEVVIDLHRDGVPETKHFVTEINGKPTARIMFFNGLSRTTFNGELEYLANPYLEDNLALSFQMQLAAAEYYPGFTRKIYLKGYRYNLHLCPKSMLVEVGAQTNTFEEAKNAMEPLADILAKVLYNGIN